MSLMLRELGLNRLRTHSKTKRNQSRVATLIGSYAIWTLLFRLLGLTFIIYFLTHTSGKAVLFDEVNETFSAHELSLVGFSALVFALLFKGFAPLWGASEVKLCSWPEIRKGFAPGFFQGALLALALVSAFLLAGTFRYVGFFVQLEEAPLAILGILIRTLSLVAFCYFEEWIFRKKVFDFLMTNSPNEPEFLSPERIWPALVKLGILSIAYCLIKWMQFELGWMHLLTLFLLSTFLSLRQLNDGTFSRGAGFWCGMLVVFQPICSLPILGNDFSGIFLVKYQEHSSSVDRNSTRFANL
jgi:hypothetical protein